MASSKHIAISLPTPGGLKQVSHAYGDKGQEDTLRLMSKFIRECGDDAAFQQFAHHIIEICHPQRSYSPSYTELARCILKYVHDNVRYVQDPPLLELVKSPKITLCVPGATACIPLGDCFPEGTMLWLTDRIAEEYRKVPIERIEVGQEIAGRRGSTRVIAKVQKGTLPITLIRLDSRETIPLTEDHHVFVVSSGAEFCTGLTATERVRVSDLQVGQQLLRHGPRAPYIERIQRSACTAPCWDIETSDGYVYLPEHDVVVSNCDELVSACLALMRSVGLDVQISLLKCRDTRMPKDEQLAYHVAGVFRKENGDYVDFDPSNKNSTIGHVQRNEERTLIDPLAPKWGGKGPELKMVAGVIDASIDVSGEGTLESFNVMLARAQFSKVIVVPDRPAIVTTPFGRPLAPWRS